MAALLSYECACGVALRFVTRRGRYEPIAPSAAPPSGHVVAVVIRDGVREQVSDRPCTAGTQDTVEGENPEC